MSPIAAGDLLLVQRGSTQYKAVTGAAGPLANAQPTDLFLVQRAGTQYRVPYSALNTVQDADLALVQRGATQYKATGAELKAWLTPVAMPWTPADLSVQPIAWWDVGDASTMTIVAGNKVSEWRSKMSGGVDKLIQSATGQQPSYDAAGLGGAGSINGSGATPGNLIGNTELAPVRSAVILMGGIDVTGVDKGVLSFDPSGRARTLVGNSTTTLPWKEGSNQRGVLWDGLLPVNLRCCVSKWPNTTNGGVIMRLNGVQKPTGSSSGPALTTARGTTYWNSLYGNTANGDPAARVNVIMLFNAVLSDAEIQKIEGWGMHRMGEAASLPSDHPYKNAPPTK